SSEENAKVDPLAASQSAAGPHDPADDATAAIETAALRQRASAGEPVAQLEIASRLGEGKGVRRDLAEAFLWIELAALLGHAPAQFRLGLCWEHGIGTTIDPERAKAWYRRAADQGVVRAMHNLAVLMVGPDKSRADYAAAARWFEEAANRGLL